MPKTRSMTVSSVVAACHWEGQYAMQSFTSEHLDFEIGKSSISIMPKYEVEAIGFGNSGENFYNPTMDHTSPSSSNFIQPQRSHLLPTILASFPLFTITL